MANLFRCGGGRSEASYQNLMDQLIEETATGPIASFTDGANNIPTKQVICHINPTETGTGEKSPSNPYVIGGFTEANITQQSTIPVTDNSPYLFRQSGGDNNADVYNQETDKLVGASAVVNQLVDSSKYQGGTYSTLVVTKSGNTLIANGTPSSTAYIRLLTDSYISTISNHRYLVVVPSNTDINYYDDSTTRQFQNKTAPFFFQGSGVDIRPFARVNSGVTLTNAIISMQMFDLTAMFGTTIADYVVSLGSSNGIAYLRKYGFFTKDYIPYMANTLQSVNTSKHSMVGLNQWDEVWENGTFNTTTGANINNSTVNKQIRSKNYIPVVGDALYYINQMAWFIFFDENKNVITEDLPSGSSSGNSRAFNNATFKMPKNCSYIRFYMLATYGDTYNNDVCLNISSSKDGTYEPYIKHEYALPNIDLRGLYKLDASNNLYADGDTLEGDGTLTRKYGIVDLGTLAYLKHNNDGYYYANIDDAKTNGLVVCSKYIYSSLSSGSNRPDKSINLTPFYGNHTMSIFDSAFAGYNSSQVKSALNGIYLIYELATPTTEQVTGFTNPQIVDKFGTEEYTDERDFPLPVGHETIYLPTGQREYTVTFGQTVYGGELVLHEGQNDKITKKMNTVDLGSLDWIRGGSDPYYFRADDIGKKKGSVNMMCSVYTIKQTTGSSNMENYQIASSSAKSDRIYIRDDRYETVEQFVEGVTGITLVYEAKETTEITLSSKTEIDTLLGDNNIYHDCNGDTDVTYRANGALYVQEHPITRGLMAARPTEQIQEQEEQQEEQQEEKEINKSEDNER